jgi:hypothetical protein
MPLTARSIRSDILRSLTKNHSLLIRSSSNWEESIWLKASAICLGKMDRGMGRSVSTTSMSVKMATTEALR